MRNKLQILSIAVITVSLGMSPDRVMALAETGNQQAAGLSDNAEICVSDIMEVEKSVKRMEDSLLKRKDERKMNEEYGRMKANAMENYGEPKVEIWKLKDRISKLAEDEQKLWSEKDKSDAELAEMTEAADTEEKGIVKGADISAAADEQLNSLRAVYERESVARKKNLENLEDQLKSLSDILITLANEKDSIEKELNTKNADYKAQESKLSALNEGLSPEKKEDVGIKIETARLKKEAEELAVRAQEWEAARQKISKEIVETSRECRPLEQEIAALKNEIVLKEKDFKAQEEDIGNSKRGVKLKAKILKIKTLSTKSKLEAAIARNKKLEYDIMQIAEQKRLAEEELRVRTEELKVRISVLLDRDEQNDQADGGYMLPHVPAKKGASKGEELSAKLMMMYKVMAEENSRLIADNKEARDKLKRAERSVKAARRRAELAVRTPDELRIKLDKERVDMHFNLAVVYEKNGLYKDAEREYLKCLYIDPNDSGAHYNMGILYDDKLNSNDKALIHYNKFLALRPMGDTAERVRDWITKIELENRLGKEMR